MSAIAMLGGIYNAGGFSANQFSGLSLEALLFARYRQ
jgi:hypothetical protein